MHPTRRRAVGHDGGGAGRCELGRAAHVVGVDVGVERRDDLDPELLGQVKVPV
jgi:hypothetical protein